MAKPPPAPPPLNFDTTLLDESEHGHILYASPGGKRGNWAQAIDLQTAIEKVTLKKATIHSPWRIKKLLDETLFFKCILEQDAHKCFICSFESSAVKTVKSNNKSYYLSLCTICASSSVVVNKVRKYVASCLQKGAVPSKIMLEQFNQDNSNKQVQDKQIKVYCDVSVMTGCMDYGIGTVLVDGSKTVTASKLIRTAVLDNPPFGELCSVFEGLIVAKHHLSKATCTYSKVRIYSDVNHIRTLLQKRTPGRLDSDRWQMVNDIQKTILDLSNAHPETKFTICYIVDKGRRRTHFYNMAHKLSRDYMRAKESVLPPPPSLSLY